MVLEAPYPLLALIIYCYGGWGRSNSGRSRRWGRPGCSSSSTVAGFSLLCFVQAFLAICYWQVQKSDRITRTASPGRINSDQLGSTRINSDHKKNKIEENEAFTHLKVKIPLKSRPNQVRLATFLRVVKPPFCIFTAGKDGRKSLGTALRNSYGSWRHSWWRLHICRSLFSLSTFLCFTRVYEGHLMSCY